MLTRTTISPAPGGVQTPGGIVVPERASLDTLLDTYGGLYIADTTARNTTNVALHASTGIVSGTVTTAAAAAHGLIANQPFKFTNLYDAVKTVTSIVAGVVTTSAAHSMVANQKFTFLSLVNAAGGAAISTDYYVLSAPTTTTFTYALSPGGAATTGHSADSGTSRATNVPATGAFSEGTVYYVLVAGSASTLTFAASPGGTAIATPDVASGTIAAVGWAGYRALTTTAISALTCTGFAGTPVDVAAGTDLRFPGGATAVTLSSGKGILINSQ